LDIGAWSAASIEGPVLVGVVTHPDGHRLAGIQARPHAGFATRFPLAETFTDDQARYRFDSVEGSITEGRMGHR
jgi:hypothetical protein